MKKHISYPKIGQFRNVVSAINRQITYVGQDENDEAIYDHSISKPIITFNGTVKLHGTNAGFCFNNSKGFWIQSRKNIITIKKDNAGFAFFAESNKGELLKIINRVAKDNDIDLDVFTISVYGEWVGKGIQKNVGISQIDKALFIFGVKISNPNDEDFNSYWVDSSKYNSNENRVFNIADYKTYSIEVDFNMPQLSQNKFAQITEDVEKECPVSKVFGIDNGLGEGVVWSTTYKGTKQVFKVKGEKHSVTKVKKLASIDVEKLESIQNFVEYAVTENRFNQAVENVFGNGELDRKKMGDFMRWIINDITTEEMDTMKGNGLEPKEVNKYISQKAREMFFKAETAC